VFGLRPWELGRLSIDELDDHERYARAWLKAMEGGGGG